MFKLKTAYIEKWRKLNNLKPLHIGNKITLISGQNGVGKSNLLSLFASGSGTSKPKSMNTSVTNFQPDFDNFFVIDPGENYPSYSIVLEYLYKPNLPNEQTITFFKDLRTKNDSNSKRGIRVIPTTTNYNENFKTKGEAQRFVHDQLNIGNDARVPIPTLFLSLSRIYPLGEGKKPETKDWRSKNNDIYKKYKEWYNTVLPDSIENITTTKMLEINKTVTKNKSYYIPIVNTTPLSQSIGQDNLNCIISALINFYELSLTKNYVGGILCIDEIDVSLHPDAQHRLILLLDKLSIELKLQIIISSHSLVIIKEILKLYEKNNDDYSVGYLINNRNPFFKEGLSYITLKKDLFLKSKIFRPKLKVYFEDDVTKDIFNLLITTYKNYSHDEYDQTGKTSHDKILHILDQLEEIPVHLGCDQLKDLLKCDKYFSSVLIVLDGDAATSDKEKFKYKDIDKYINNKIYPNDKPNDKNILCLPSIFPPEVFIYRIIRYLVENENEHCAFWREIAEYDSLDLNTAQLVREFINKIFLEESSKKSSLKNNYQDMFKFTKQSNLLNYYYHQKLHKKELNDFIMSFTKKSSILLTRLKGELYQD